MKLAIMQPYLFPYLGYYQLISAVDRFVILDDVNHIPRGWVNRNRILVNGQPYTFTLPLEHASQNKHIRELSISPEIEKWRKSFLRTLELNYRKAPFFTQTFELVASLLDQASGKLADFLLLCIKTTMKYLAIDTMLIDSSTTYGNRHLSGSERILDICRLEHADEYINAPGGTHLYDRAQFAAMGIKLQFINNDARPYFQNTAEFTPNLSIIDVMMFNPVNEIMNMLDCHIME